MAVRCASIQRWDGQKAEEGSDLIAGGDVLPVGRLLDLGKGKNPVMFLLCLTKLFPFFVSLAARLSNTTLKGKNYVTFLLMVMLVSGCPST